jgi:recombination protein RecA
VREFLVKGEVLQLGTDAKLITKSGAWYSYVHEKLDNGKDKSIQYLKENPVLANKI